MIINASTISSNITLQQLRLTKLELAKADFAKWPYKLGDVAIHPVHGTVLIKDLNWNEYNSNITCTLAVSTIGQGEATCPIEELIAYNETSLVLYGRK